MRALLKSRLTLPALLIAVLFLIATCGSDPIATPRPEPTQPPATEAPAASGEAMEDGEAMAMESGSLSLKLTGIQPLANVYHYEGWAIVDGSPVTTGKFSGLVGLSGAPIPDGVFKPVAGIEGAAAIVITIEPAGDVDTVPAATKYSGGNVLDGSSNLSAAHGSSLGDDFSAAAGVYILATPTDGPDNKENSGI